MSQNTVLDSQGAFPPEYTSRAVPPELSVVPVGPAAPAVDPVRSLAESWHRQSASDWSVPVQRPFDAQYWACWLVAVVFPVLVGYLLLAR
ncbi:hypothetical protein [uncultured Friedmanniella sp.]|uniref:hypothetical protein n=1 Tax=uncultured Friedmanniella sp. TaxID=335381 RepID=UPI0035C9E3FA